MARIYRLKKNQWEDSVSERKNGQRSDVFTEYMIALSKKKEKNTNIIEERRKMSKVLMIGAGGVATVAAYKIAQNPDVFTDFMIASRRKEKCDKLVAAIHAKGYTMDIKTAQVDADDVEQLKALFNDYQPELVINLALPYQDLTHLRTQSRNSVWQQ